LTEIVFDRYVMKCSDFRYRK